MHRPICRLLHVALLALVLGSSSAISQTYPARTIVMTVPNPPGGPLDWLARAVGAELQERWSHPVVVENKPGGGGVAGIEAVREAPADGHALLVFSTSIVYLPLLLKDVTLVIGKDIQPVTPALFSPYVVLVPPQLGVKDLKQFVALVKSNPGKYNVAHGVGGVHMLDSIRFVRAAGLQMQPIQYKGGPALLQAIMTNESQAYLATTFNLNENVKSGRVVALAVTSEQRFPSIPNIPTVKESIGLDFEASGQFGFFTTGGTPRPLVDRLWGEITDIVKGKLAAPIRNLGYEPLTLSPDEWTARMLADLRRGQEVANAIGLKRQ